MLYAAILGGNTKITQLLLENGAETDQDMEADSVDFHESEMTTDSKYRAKGTEAALGAPRCDVEIMSDYSVLRNSLYIVLRCRVGYIGVSFVATREGSYMLVNDPYHAVREQ